MPLLLSAFSLVLFGRAAYPDNAESFSLSASVQALVAPLLAGLQVSCWGHRGTEVLLPRCQGFSLATRGPPWFYPTQQLPSYV